MNSMMCSIGDEPGEFDLLAVTFHIRCKCGAKWDLRKKAK
jgi:hypothetical protein